MTHVTIDAATLARLSNLADITEFRDESGRVLGHFHPLKPSAACRSPISDEEIQRRRQLRSGRPLSEVLKDLQDVPRA